MLVDTRVGEREVLLSVFVRQPRLGYFADEICRAVIATTTGSGTTRCGTSETGRPSSHAGYCCRQTRSAFDEGLMPLPVSLATLYAKSIGSIRVEAKSHYGEMFTPMPMGTALPEMTRAPAFTPTVRAEGVEDQIHVARQHTLGRIRHEDDVAGLHPDVGRLIWSTATIAICGWAGGLRRIATFVRHASRSMPHLNHSTRRTILAR